MRIEPDQKQRGARVRRPESATSTDVHAARSDTDFVALQEWEGYVIAINDDDFEARLLDLTANAKREEEEATIPFSAISEKDRDEMRLGSIFHWSIGYNKTTGNRTRRTISKIVFRDTPVLTQRDMDEAWEWALETRRLLGLDPPDRPAVPLPSPDATPDRATD